jgi:hypothetical protein
MAFAIILHDALWKRNAMYLARVVKAFVQL